MNAPLADRIRPKTLDDVVGQQHILGPNKVLRRIIESGTIPNMVFYGPSGVGKTTVASIIAKQSHMHLCKLNGTTASTADIRDVVAQVNTLQAVNGVLLYLDEIQYFNKKQQQTLLEFIENGSITLIASTTENPYFYVYNAILSRSTVFDQARGKRGGRPRCRPRIPHFVGRPRRRNPARRRRDLVYCFRLRRRCT